MPPIYPASDLDQANRLLSVVGSFWSDMFTGSVLVESMLYARAQLEAENHLRMLDLIASMSRFTVPIFKRDNWYVLQLKESDMDRTLENLPHFDGTYQFREAQDINYGEPIKTPYFSWNAPASLASAKLVLNRITDASLTWTHGTDFLLEDGVLKFRLNPFDNDLVVKQEVFSGNTVVDRVATLWIYHGQFDFQTVYRQFGYVLGLRAASSEAYRAYLNAIFDSLVDGTTQTAVEAAFSALCDVPLTIDATETVEMVQADRWHLCIVTDKHAYRFPLTATALVEVGDIVKAGQPLTDGVQFFEFNRGQLPDEIRALVMGKGILANGYFQDLVFENKVCETQVITDDPTGYTRFQFPIHGAPGDIEKFWDDVHAAGVAEDQTLAMLMDQRPTPSGQPATSNLPETINPLQFVVENVFRNNYAVVRLNPDGFGRNAMTLHNARILRQIIPPHTMLIVLVQLAIEDDPIIMDGPGDEENAGYEEDVTVFIGTDFAEEIDPDDYIDERVRLLSIQGSCG